MVLGCMMPEMFAGLGINAGPSTGSTSGEISRPKTTLQASMDVCKKLGQNKKEHNGSIHFACKSWFQQPKPKS